MPSRTRQIVEIVSPAGIGKNVTLLHQFTLLYAACQLHISERYGLYVSSSKDRLIVRRHEPPRVSVKSELCLYTPNTNRVYIKDFPPTVTAEQTHSLSPSCLPVLNLLPFPPSFFPSLLSLSLYFPPPVVLVGGRSVTSLCAHWPMARWWFIAEESRGLGDEVGGWLV